MLQRICLTLVGAALLVAAPQTRATAAIAPDQPAVTPDAVHLASGSADANVFTRLLASDMSLPSERMPEGVPSWYDWARAPRARPIAPFHSFQAFTAWGQLYQCAGTRPTRGAAIELRDLQAWVFLRGAHRWREVQLSSDLEGGAFAEDYQGPTLRAHYFRTPAGTTVRPLSGHNFHFWPGSGRVSLRGSQVVGVVVAVRARLRPGSASADSAPCLVLSVGGDMWRSLDAKPVAGANGDVGIGRFKLVQRRWRLFSMTSAPAGLLERVPLESLAPAGDDF